MRSPNLFREGIFANAGCLTRGSLPVPKRSNLADSEDEVDEDEDDDNASAARSKKRTRTNETTTDATEYSDSHELFEATVADAQETSEAIDASHCSFKQIVKGGQIRISRCLRLTQSLAMTEKKGRISLLLSGPRTADWLTFSDCPVPIGLRKSRVNKSDLGKLSLMMFLPIDVLYEVRGMLIRPLLHITELQSSADCISSLPTRCAFFVADESMPIQRFHVKILEAGLDRMPGLHADAAMSSESQRAPIRQLTF